MTLKIKFSCTNHCIKTEKIFWIKIYILVDWATLWILIYKCRHTIHGICFLFTVNIKNLSSQCEKKISIKLFQHHCSALLDFVSFEFWLEVWEVQYYWLICTHWHIEESSLLKLILSIGNWVLTLPRPSEISEKNWST